MRHNDVVDLIQISISYMYVQKYTHNTVLFHQQLLALINLFLEVYNLL